MADSLNDEWDREAVVEADAQADARSGHRGDRVVVPADMIPEWDALDREVRALHVLDVGSTTVSKRSVLAHLVPMATGMSLSASLPPALEQREADGVFPPTRKLRPLVEDHLEGIVEDEERGDASTRSSIGSISSTGALASRDGRALLPAPDASDRNANDGNGQELRAEVVFLREQVALLVKNLEEEKKRRASEQTLMQQKILELQALIRSNLPEEQKALERRLQSRSPVARSHPRKHSVRAHSRSAVHGLRSPPRLPQVDNQDGDESEHAPEGDSDVKASEVRLKKQLTKLRARMHAMVIEAQQDASHLRNRLAEMQRAFDKKERQMKIDQSSRILTLEEKHANIKKKLSAKATMLSTQVSTLTEQREQLEKALREKQERIEHLERAVAGKHIVFG